MKRTVPVCLIVSLATLTSCRDREPPRQDNIVAAQQEEDIGQPVDQTPPNTCFGQETDEQPDLDTALEVTREGERTVAHITLAERKGLRLCTIKLQILHNTRNPKTGEWEWDLQWAGMVIDRVEPGEIKEEEKSLSSDEFPEVTEIGPPEAWTLRVIGVGDVRKPQTATSPAADS